MEQPATIGTLPIAVAHTEGVLVGYLPGLAMRCIADLQAGDAKTDARDAAIIAQAARALPHALRAVQLADEQLAVLSMLCGFDDDLVGQATSTSNRTRASSPRFTPPWNELSARIWTMRPCCARTAPSTVTRSWPTIQYTNAILDENSCK